MAKSVTLEQTNLEWQTFDGSLPDGAVSFYNGYEKRTDYVARYGIEAGFYNPKMGSHCHYAWGAEEHFGSPFEILVNKDDFESLKWKNGSYGSVPANAVYSSPDNMYVARNQYGLGKVHFKHKAFFLPWGGKEYRYDEYQILTFNSDVISEHMSDVKYKTDDLKIIECPPETLTQSPITNNSDHLVTQTVTLSKSIQLQQRWDTSFSMTAGVTAGITAGIPFIGKTSIEVKLETTLQLSKGNTRTESNTYSVAVECKVPPKHYSNVRMVAFKHGADIPYTARLKRTYKNGETKWTSITGTYKGVNVGEVRAVVDPCKDL